MPLDRRKYAPQGRCRMNITFLCILLFCYFPSNSLQDPTRGSLTSSCPSLCTCSYSEKLVNCSNRSLRKLPKIIPSWVVVLSFRNNKITGSELRNEKFHNLLNLKEIDFSDNRLNKVNISLQKVPLLRTLRFDRCSLDAIPTISGDAASNITHLSLSHNSIMHIGDTFKYWPSLQWLDLSFNRIRYIPDMAFHRQNYLTDLFFEKNRVSAVGRRAFLGANSLQHLSLGRNRIRDLKNLTHSDILDQSCVGDLKNLIYLDLSKNHIGRIESLTFQGMCRLETLLLNDNSISALPDGAFYSLKALILLNMENNMITSVSREWLFDLESLQTLSLSHNNITNIRNKSWKFCAAIQRLNMSYNDLTMLPSNIFMFLHSLTDLDLSYNSIEVVEDKAFADLTSLHTLDLSYNRISSMVEDISGAFTGLIQLKNLSLRSNKIRALSSGVFRGVEGVVYLDLRQNDVTSIQNRTFDGFSKLKELNMDSASLLCDCQLAWFSRWLRDRHDNMTSQINARCFHPPRLKGRNVVEVQRHELECGEHPVPTLLQQPSMLTSYKGENVTLECSASATLTTGQASSQQSSMTVVWRRGPNREVISESRSMRIRNQQRQEGGHVFFTSLLLLYDVDYDDEENYSCVILNNFGHATSNPSRLRVVALPRIIVEPENRTVKCGTEVQLGCQATGHPLPQISWERADGLPFAAADERRMVLEFEARKSRKNGDAQSEKIEEERAADLRVRGGGLEATDDAAPLQKRKVLQDTTKNIPLHIRELKPEDGGRYKCTAKSAVGEESAFVTLTVLYPPFINNMKDEIKMIRGGNAVLKCMADAHPPPAITWTFNNSPLKGTARHFFAANGQLLVIVDAGPKDQGTYLCTATNYLGIAREESKLVLVASLDEELGDDVWDALKGPPGIVAAVLVCILLTSMVWLAVLCCTRRNYDGTQSTNTDTSDLPQVDSSSRDSLDIQQGHSTFNLSATSRKDPYNSLGRHYCAPDLLVPSSYPYSFRSVPRNGRVDHFIRKDVSKSPMRDGFCHVRPRPPMRAASTSHMYSIEPREARSAYSSAHCIPKMTPNKAPQASRVAPSHWKRRRRGKRAGSTKGDSSVAANSSSSESDNGDESQRLYRLRPTIRAVHELGKRTTPQTTLERTNVKTDTDGKNSETVSPPSEGEAPLDYNEADPLRDHDPPT